MKKSLFIMIICGLCVSAFAQSDVSINATDIPIKADAIVYPNPCRNKVSLQVKAFEPGMLAIRLIDISGNVLKEESRLLINGDDEEVVLFFFLPAGIYFITMQQGQLFVRKKLIVE